MADNQEIKILDGINGIENTDLIEYAVIVLKHNFTLLQHAETKANMVLGIVGIMLSILLSMYQTIKTTPFIRIPFFFLISTCVISGLKAIETIRARITIDEPDNFLYYMHILNMKRNDFVASFKKLSEREKSDSILNEIYTLAVIQKTKYAALNQAINWLIITFILLGYIVIANKLLY